MKIHNFIDHVPNRVNIRPNQNISDTTNNDRVSSFKDVLQDILSETQTLRAKDEQNNVLLSAGNMDNLDNIMIDMEKADIALQFTLQVRNKILDAYQEIMRMQI